MPSPLAHSAIGYVLYRVTKTPETARRIGTLPVLLLVTLVASNLPDLDFVAGFIFGDLWAYHNQISHSMVVATAFSLLAAGLVALLSRTGFWRWFMILALSYNLHIVMDFFTYKTRGIMLLWPFSNARFESSVKLFYGVRWSEGLLSPNHLVTLATEIGFIFLLVLIGHLVARYRGSNIAGRGDISVFEEGGHSRSA